MSRATSFWLLFSLLAPAAHAAEAKCDVILVDPGPARLAVVQVIRRYTRQGVGEIVAALESMPYTAIKGLSKDKAAAAAEGLRGAGAQVHARCGATEIRPPKARAPVYAPGECAAVLVEGGTQPQRVVGRLSTMLGFTTKQAEAAIDAAPGPVHVDVANFDARRIVDQLRSAGATAEVRCGAPGPCDVVLVSAGEGAVEVTRALLDLTGVTLDEARAWVDKAPSTVLEKRAADSARRAAAALEAAGGEARLEGCDAP